MLTSTADMAEMLGFGYWLFGVNRLDSGEEDGNIEELEEASDSITLLEADSRCIFWSPF